jgi:DNA-binding NarL/FixJ family response regulator
MVLVAAWPEVAMEIGAQLLDEKAYACKVMHPHELRHAVKKTQPDVVVLDVRIGGSRWRAVEGVQRLRLCESRPEVIALVPRRSRAVDREMARQGCYGVVDLSVGSWPDALVRAVETAHQIRELKPWRAWAEMPSVSLH